LHDDEEKAWRLTFDFTWDQRLCLVAKLENTGFMGAKINRLNQLLNAAEARKILPGAQRILDSLQAQSTPTHPTPEQAAPKPPPPKQHRHTATT